MNVKGKQISISKPWVFLIAASMWLALVSGLQIDEERHTAAINDRQLKLSPVEFALLSRLAAQPGRVFSRDQLMSSIYADYRIVSDRTVDTHVKNLRRKLADAGPDTDLIESVYGVGYRLAT